jgi:hypothetical protein
MTNNQRSHVLYTGITGDLPGRVFEHKHKLSLGFTSRYNLTRLVYCDNSVTPATQFKGKANQELGPQQENQADRQYESPLARPGGRLRRPIQARQPHPANPRQILHRLTATQDDVK